MKSPVTRRTVDLGSYPDLVVIYILILTGRGNDHMREILIRSACGAAIVSSFAVLGHVLKPKSFAPNRPRRDLDEPFRYEFRPGQERSSGNRHPSERGTFALQWPASYGYRHRWLKDTFSLQMVEVRILSKKSGKE